MKYLIALVLFAGVTPLMAAENLEESIVQVASYTQTTDFDSPWRQAEPKPQYHLGTLIEGDKILVSALAVAEARHLEMRRVGTSRRYPLNVAFVDYTANVALLTPQDPQALKGLRPLSLGGLLKPGDQAWLIAGTRGDRLMRLPLRLREVEMRRGGTAQFIMPHYDFEVRQNSGLGWSEPVVDNGKLLGLAVGQTPTSLFALPAKVLKHILNDNHSKSGYRGFARLGLIVRNFSSPEGRAWLKSPKETRGVFIADVSRNSPYYGKIQPRDLLVKVGDTEIADSGTYQHSTWGRLSFTDRVTDYYAGDEVPVTVVREGKELTFKEQLKRFQMDEDFIPESYDNLARHLIFGGLVFQEMSKNFLEAWGDEWTKAAPDHLVFDWFFHNRPPENPGDRIIVLNRVLADQFNRGYEKLSNAVLATVNGIKVTSLTSLGEALKKPVKKNGENFAVFNFDHGAGTVVLSYKGLESAHARMERQYGIKGDAQFFKD